MKNVKNTSQLSGLTDSEVKSRLEMEGYNELESTESKNFLAIMFGVVKEPMFLLLVACGTLYMLLGDIQEGLILLGFVFVIMGIEFYQERKSEKALNALKNLASPRALVIRDNTEIRIPGREVVCDDIIVLQEGDRIPADATILKSVNLLVDESLLTGESIPVRKHAWAGESDNIQPGGDDQPFVYSSSMVIQGNGLAKVTHTGMNTQVGNIGKSISKVEESPSLLKKEIGSLVKYFTIVGGILFIMVVVLYTFTRGDLLQGFLAGITLAMAMLPEEFPVVLTIFMAVGAWRISKKRVLTRQPNAIETLGSATVLCTDKTGTLTENKMKVTKLYNKENFLTPEYAKDFPGEYHDIIEYGILSSQINPFDPMEKAINHIGETFLKNTEHIHDGWEMIKEYSLSKELLAMSRVFKSKTSNQLVIAAKGAPEAIFELCHLPTNIREKYMVAAQTMASEGLRVLGVSKSCVLKSHLPEIQHDFKFEFVGLIGLSDPIRSEVPQAVHECHKAGIRVIMITGDYPITAQNIAKEIGLQNYHECITGSELAEMDETVLSEKIKTIDVFARVVPEQKLKIVNALKHNNEIVAMTGDGVNDAPALKSANIGISMGKKGTDVAREASELVLIDDNFGSIVKAVKMGRRIFDNLQKALGYIFAIHVPIAGLSLIPVFFTSWPLILWPVHVVFLELIIDPACSVIFEAEKPEKNVMSRPPRKINEVFFGSKKIFISCFQGICILIVSLGVYFVTLKMGYNIGEVKAMTFTTLIFANIATILTNRSWESSIFTILQTPNKTVKWIIGGAILFIILVLTVPFLQQLFQFEPISILEIAIMFTVGMSTMICFEVYKYFRRKFN
ncbi:MAG: cation-translocating P-type ATPase [Methanobacteriaceae archaeon]|jgi:Ca2+-transporting ATPase|nr:cation-translocating P-type ATPase [Candidatus Methanorudis spinitermitis]